MSDHGCGCCGCIVLPGCFGFALFPAVIAGGIIASLGAAIALAALCGLVVLLCVTAVAKAAVTTATAPTCRQAPQVPPQRPHTGNRSFRASDDWRRP